MLAKILCVTCEVPHETPPISCRANTVPIIKYIAHLRIRCMKCYPTTSMYRTPCNARSGHFQKAMSDTSSAQEIQIQILEFEKALLLFAFLMMVVLAQRRAFRCELWRWQGMGFWTRSWSITVAFHSPRLQGHISQGVNGRLE